MSVQIGQQLGSYEITALLGKIGMDLSCAINAYSDESHH